MVTLYLLPLLGLMGQKSQSCPLGLGLDRGHHLPSSNSMTVVPLLRDHCENSGSFACSQQGRIPQTVITSLVVLALLVSPNRTEHGLIRLGAVGPHQVCGSPQAQHGRSEGLAQAAGAGGRRVRAREGQARCKPQDVG